MNLLISGEFLNKQYRSSVINEGEILPQKNGSRDVTKEKIDGIIEKFDPLIPK